MNLYELRSRAQLKIPIRYEASVMFAEYEPSTFENFEFRRLWKLDSNHGWREEISKWKWNMNTRRITKITKATPCKCIYQIKTHPNGTVERYKARLIIKRYSQKTGEDLTIHSVLCQKLSQLEL